MKCACGSVQSSVRSSVLRSVCLFDTTRVYAWFVLSMLLFVGQFGGLCSDQIVLIKNE